MIALAFFLTGAGFITVGILFGWDSKRMDSLEKRIRKLEQIRKDKE